MNKRIVLFFIIWQIYVPIFANVNVLFIDRDTSYFKKDKLGYYYDLKDSLPDGQYMVWRHDYTHKKKSKRVSKVIFGNYISGHKHGLFRYYSGEGSDCFIREIKSYEHGILNGPFELRYHANRVESIGNYKNGKQDGLWISFYLSGEKESLVEYRSDSIISWIFLFKNSLPYLQGRGWGKYLNDTIKYFDTLGNCTYWAKYRAGQLTHWRTLDSSGQTLDEAEGDFQSFKNKMIENDYICISCLLDKSLPYNGYYRKFNNAFLIQDTKYINGLPIE